MKIKNIMKIILYCIFEHPYVSVVDINLTTKCNHKCVYCEIGQGLIKKEQSNDTNSLHLEDLKWIINQMNQNKIPSVVLLGGEPFLFKDIFELLDYASTYLSDITIITNGMQIPRLSDTEIALLKRTNCKIILSLDSFNPQTHNRIRGVETAFENAINAIKILVQNQIPVQIETVISLYNYQDLANVVRNAHALGVSSVNFVPIITASNFSGVQAIPQKEELNPKPDHMRFLDDEFNKILKFERDHTIQTNVSDLKLWLQHYITFHARQAPDTDFFFKYRLQRLFCLNVYSRIKINAFGEVQPCNLIPSSITIHDNHNRSLVDVWNTSCNQLRTAMKEQKYPEQCHGCYGPHSMNILLSTIKYPFSNRANIPGFLRETIQKLRK